MPNLGLIKSCNKYFGTDELYKVLGVEKTATEAEIKKAYYKTSLNVHPDRVIESGRKDATEKFQILGQVYSILSNKDKRAIYDETGNVDEDDEDEPRDWNEYWGLLFKKVTVDDIEKFKEEYQGSNEETDDLKEIYGRNKGNMTKIMENMFFADVDNEDRLRNILLDLIDKGNVTKYDIFVNEPGKEKEKRRKKQMKEKKEAEEEMSKMAGKSSSSSNGSSLIAKIRENEKNRLDSRFLENLEKKYGGKNTSKKRARESPSSSQSSARVTDDDDGADDDDDDYVETKKPKRKVTKKATTESRDATKAKAAPKSTARKSMRGAKVIKKRGKGVRK